MINRFSRENDDPLLHVSIESTVHVELSQEFHLSQGSNCLLVRVVRVELSQ